MQRETKQDKCMNAFQYISTSPLCKSGSDCDISSICCGVTSLDHSICVPLNHSDLVVLGYGGRTSEVNPALSLPIPRPIPVPPLLASLTSVSPPKSPNYIYAPNARYKWYNLNVQTLFSYEWWKKIFHSQTDSRGDCRRETWRLHGFDVWRFLTLSVGIVRMPYR